ncbi:MAG TPA: sterol desaturase family protein [Casimicrobiaceae bacterium]|jgi:sterol desaturase/sphingolipid hydroxylase (fatty acid hydroxylase superfamily)
MNESSMWLGVPFASVAIVGAAFIVLFAAERLVPLRARRTAVAGRLVVNACVSALALITAYFVVTPAAMAALQAISVQRMGALQWVRLSEAVEVVVGFVLMDLSFYYWHMANHKIRFLWRFHNVHHIDPDLDVSTAFRFHFGEVALSAIFRVVQIVLIGVTPLTFALYEIVFELNTLFHHSNVRLPLALERWLNKVLVTPRMHGIHHSDVRQENNANYSIVLSWWDRLHRTLRLNIAQRSIVIGIPAYLDPANNVVGNVLVLPFRTQRAYWQTVDGTIVVRTHGEAAAPRNLMQA